MRKFQYLLFLLLIIAGCSTSKNTSTTRSFHNLTAHYNVYFNANESLKNGLKKLEKKEEDYSQMLPVFKYEDKNSANLLSSEMDLAIKKCAKTIKTHSITVKPKTKNKDISKKDKDFLSKTEYCKWIDDAYFVMGKAHFYKREFETAKQTFIQNINKYPQENTTEDAKLWLAKTYAESDDYLNAETLLSELRKSHRRDKVFQREIDLSYASIYLKQRDYTNASQKLNDVLAAKLKRRENPRLFFILAQVYQSNNQFPLAVENYKKVIRQNPNYEMTFKSKINLAELYQQSGGDAEDLKKQFIKMLNDEKNIDYFDQLYFALGKIEQNQNNEEKAIEYFHLSSSAKSSNRTQKAKTYLALGNLYYTREKYGFAELYFDSTLSAIEKTYPDYENIYPLTQNKRRLSRELNIIQTEDSLQRFAKLPEKERNSIIDGLIEKVRQAEQLAANAKANKNFDPYLANNDMDMQRNINTGDGAVYYFYNPSVVSFGQTEFKKRWGDRKLEDNWRRSNKQNTTVIDENISNSESKKDSVKSEQKITNNKSREYYLQDVPLTPEQLKISDLRIEDAFYNSGSIYDKEFNETNKSIQQFERLLLRFPESKYRLDSYQKLHMLYLKKQDFQMAEKISRIIIKEFPESMYAKMLSDPGYVQKLKKKEDEVEKLYQTAYKRYIDKEYIEAIGYCEHGLKNFPESELIPKFMFLQAMAYVESGDKEQFKKILTQLVAKHPKEEVAIRGAAMLEIVSGRKFEQEIYLPSNDSVHYYAVVYPKSKIDINKLKFSYISFNAKKYTQENFSIIVVSLDNLRDILLVRTFKNSSHALQYFQQTIVDGVLKEYAVFNPTTFIISSNNYKTFLQNKDDSQYLKFFDKQYLIH